MTTPAPSRIVIVVPDGLAVRGDPGHTRPEPSFAYRAVLDHVVARHCEKRILLAPANDFGCGTPEQEAARRYLAAQGVLDLEAPPSPPGNYIDTRGNAALLRSHLEQKGDWPLPPAILVATRPHMRRALLCFEREGFLVQTPEAIAFRIPVDERVPARLWFHRHPFFHRLYEWGATLRDTLRP